MNTKNRKLMELAVLATILFTAGRGMAGSLDPTNAPGPTMHTLEEIYQKLTGGAAPSAGSLDPTNAPGPTMHTLQEIYDTIPPMQTLSATTTVVQAGYYAATTLTAVDADLVTGNLKAGVTLFGVTGTPSVVDTATGNAVAGDMLAGKTAYVNGAQITGIAYPAPVAKTGQTPTVPLNPALAGSDGALQKGVALPSPRFVNNSNGTVTDQKTGLIWLQRAYAITARDWPAALTICNIMASGSITGLTDGSVAGDWRLPNIDELHSLIAWQYTNPALANTAGTGKWTNGNPFTSVQSAIYWSSTTHAEFTDYAWYVDLNEGYMYSAHRTSLYYVWPVRGGQ